jgi:hypothetical protein
MPPPPGTSWAPLPYKQFTYKCNLCGSIFTQRNNESVELLESHLIDIIWDYLETQSPNAREILTTIGDPVMPALVEIVQMTYEGAGKERLSLEETNKVILSACKKLIAVMGYQSHQRLGDILGAKDPKIRKTAAILINAIDPPEVGLAGKIHYWLDNIQNEDITTKLLLLLYLCEIEPSNQIYYELEQLAHQLGLENPGLYGKIMVRATAELMRYR